jgi:endonuclease/exonuclease/phosphatase family metal-dependent hydrolase
MAACDGQRVFRLLTYNVHRCQGMDRRHDPKRIAAVIASCKPDIVTLQELDVGRARSGGVDQAQIIAAELGMTLHFHPALKVADELYGDAILTAAPMRLVRTGGLRSPNRRRNIEPRGALWARIEIEGREVDVINTHLGLNARERVLQMQDLLGNEWIGEADAGPLILTGDFNAVPRSRPYRMAAQRLGDAQRLSSQRRPAPTFPTRLPVLPLDHIFISAALKAVWTQTLRTAATRLASDHLPLMADLDFAEAA